MNLPFSSPGRCGAVKYHSSAIVPGRCGSSSGYFSQTSAYQPPERETPPHTFRRTQQNLKHEQTNGIELYVSSERIGASEPVSSEEVIRSLNINTLHHSLEPFGITQVSSEVRPLLKRRMTSSLPAPAPRPRPQPQAPPPGPAPRPRPQALPHLPCPVGFDKGQERLELWSVAVLAWGFLQAAQTCGPSSPMGYPWGITLAWSRMDLHLLASLPLITKNVLHGQHEGDVWNREGFYVVVIFLTIFIIIVTCLMRIGPGISLFRTQTARSDWWIFVLSGAEKGEYSDRHLKDPGPVVREVHLTPVAPHGSQPVLIYSSMVQASLCPQPACSPASTAVTACSPASNADTTVIACSPSNSPAVPSRDATKPPTHTGCSSEPQGPSGPPGPLAPEIRPCFSSSLSPFKMKPAAGLQERRGSNVSLVLDMSALGSVEPLSCSVTTPRERAAQEYLQSASRVLTRQQLQDVALNTQALQVEFAEIPMNFVDPKDLDIPSHGTKNRYKTILPNPHSRVVLRIRNANDPLSCYINANYIRGYLREDKAFIATQGPMINTVNDFWQMAWQDNCPVIVMITKLKEKNEKCVLYWPEKRGIYGKVEVLVNGVRECEHYTVRSLTLKQSGQSRKVCHYWYTSWPDHKTPDSVGPLLQLMTDVEEARHALDACGPIVVHCSAGIGRTGCFIATTIGCRQLRLEGVVDILSIVCQLRADRGGMIQTGEQYEFVHHALSLYESQLSAETSR
ncbi:hypothetical protein P4O66_014191 [Electrophorus voltai]|uniref:protein-tyrosine-phosphatase n=1 Tax=Electrophorus voltai TaxID=2609070 RepID=A0AAD9DPE6_9TELE|nr:hypothetical protein P4O66_014191 [Electrophorus voltai]